MKLFISILSSILLAASLSACGGGSSSSGSDSSSSNDSNTGVITKACESSASGVYNVTQSGCTSNNQTLACQGSTMRILSGSQTLAQVLAGGAMINAPQVNFNGVQYKCE